MLEDNSVRLPLLGPCSNCKTELDSAACVNGQRTEMKEGQFMICAHCGNVSVYTADHTLRDAKEEDVLKLPKRQLQILLAASLAVALRLAAEEVSHGPLQ